MKTGKDIVASVKARLLNIARKEGKSHQLLLLRYFQERFLYRLSVSKYKQHFCLKGATLLYALEGEKSRVTRDIDFLGIHIQPTHRSLLEAITYICQVPCDEDGVTFDLESARINNIQINESYQGIRISINGHLDRTKEKVQIDIGFGDAVIPAPAKITYPVILEMEAPTLLAYSLESTIAEKFEAMIDLGEINTRMKDYYDVYHLLRNYPIDSNTLEKAIRETFKRRKTPTSSNHSLFMPTFYQNNDRNALWKAWLRKTHLSTGLEFSTVMKLIVERLRPIYVRIP